ncbi:uncharacterized protein PGTG_01379 [Puccinia graminis f. sp. tritici CRL 75-36-700-3]|uniref:Uncharacterized protein n=1 Tax=Puccinia graminis f. sp. tritici (strain CRL 75-36-700-3 / race SCCL) TaxID=418459 RepID=E3JVH3_PUCGT|nr:uncharacterized protein PGTG_01379 [Puccinia graminis f. sp. tritici CRL 75-36-700-3]EFP76048.1 hypothetical protein PGTG_01379 [Puccinia graminis f. sp. tritici CRL 75-36-700-3]
MLKKLSSGFSGDKHSAERGIHTSNRIEVLDCYVNKKQFLRDDQVGAETAEYVDSVGVEIGQKGNARRMRILFKDLAVSVRFRVYTEEVEKLSATVYPKTSSGKKKLTRNWHDESTLTRREMIDDQD